MGELGHIFLQGEMEMKGVARGGRVRESSAEQQEWTRSKAGRSTENLVIEFSVIGTTLMSSCSIVIQSASSYLSLCVCLFIPICPPHPSVPQVTSQRMQGLLLLIFAKYFHLPFLRSVQTETTRTGLGGYWVRRLLTPFCDPHCVMETLHMEA